MLDFPSRHFRLARTGDADGRVPKKGNRNALGAMASGIFRKGTAGLGISHSRSQGERRCRRSRNHATKNSVPDDESLSVFGRTSNGRAVSQDRGDFGFGRKRNYRALVPGSTRARAAAESDASARFQYRLEPWGM